MYGTNRINYGLSNPNFISNIYPKIADIFRFCDPISIKEDIVYSKSLENKYENSKILLLGGGGSTNRILKDINIKDYDFIWSLNNFYKNEYIYNNIKVDLFSVGPEVDLKDPLLIKYLENNKTIAAFELHEKWARNFQDPVTGRMPKELNIEVNEFYNSNFKAAFQTKFYSQLGGGVRLLILASSLGVKEVHFSGFDGPISIANKDHAFEKGKGKFSSFVAAMPDTKKYAFFKEQYDFFWSYITKNNSLKLITLEYNPLHEKLYEISNSRM